MQQPASVKVSGHLVDIPNPLLLNVLLIGASGPPMESAAKLDGSFEFPGVPPGSYTLRAPGAASVAVTVRDSDLTIDLRPEYEGVGVKLGGTVEGVENLASGRTPTVVLSRLTSHVIGFAGGGGVITRVITGGGGIIFETPIA